ncbi:uncharacterized protein isoform X2 [Leptinotarsa decemlineata]|uniref:uncharacterized protein isoform X2 n=1 Tax=Leptinotarsa decemlineata TaxID=7539 RepID=UPI003D30AE4A
MNKDDFDLIQQLRRDRNDLSIDLEDRRLGFVKKNVRTKENIALFAEEQFARKTNYNEMRCEMPGTPRSTFLMVFSPDGSKVASTHGNHNIYITDLRSGKHIKTLVGHPRTPWCIAFHPTSNQIIASGCLGGQVRIWDLSGGSEVWTTSNGTVIASLAFHPNDRVLAIATFNFVYFWDWSKSEPFVQAATYNTKEKVRYVAFDSLGHKLITGIANSPMTRWERVSAPVPVPRQERCASPYRRRITQRLVSHNSNVRVTPNPASSESARNVTVTTDVGLSDRERRITMCYRNLVREYEQLVHRYLQLYRPPTMIDRGTDPMEPNPWINNSGTQTTEPQPSTSSTTTSTFVQYTENGENTQNVDPTVPSTSRSTGHVDPAIPSTSRSTDHIDRAIPSTSRSTGHVDPGPSTSGNTGPSTSGNSRIEGEDANTGDNSPTPSTSSNSPQKSQNLLTPSRIFSVIKKPNTLIRGTQTSESRKHKSEDCEEPKEKRMRSNDLNGDYVVQQNGMTNNTDNGNVPSQSDLTVNDAVRLSGEDEESSIQSAINSLPGESYARAVSIQNEIQMEREIHSHLIDQIPGSSSSSNSREGDSSNLTAQNNVDELLSSIRRTAEEEVRNRILPIIRSVPANDRAELIRLFESSREHVRMRFRQMYPVFMKTPSRRLPNNMTDTTSGSSSSEEELTSNARLGRHSSESITARGNNSSSVNTIGSTGANNSPILMTTGNNNTVRNFNTELEQLLTSLLTEIERNETDSTEANENPSSSTQPPPSEDNQDSPPRLISLGTRPPLPTTTSYGCHSIPPHSHERYTPLNSSQANNSSATVAPITISPLPTNLLFQEFIQVFQNRFDGERTREPSIDARSGESSRDARSGESSRDARSGESSRDTRSGESYRDERSGESSRDERSGESSRDTRSRESSREARPGGLSRDARLSELSVDASRRESSLDARLRESSLAARLSDSPMDTGLRNSFMDLGSRESSSDTRFRQASLYAQVRQLSMEARLRQATLDASSRGSPSLPFMRLRDALEARFRQAEADAGLRATEAVRDSGLRTTNGSGTVPSNSTGTTNSTVYTSSGGPAANRRRFFSHRISAFMPTRVDFTRSTSRSGPSRLRRNVTTHTVGRTRMGPRQSPSNTFGIDELMNYSELENSEDDSPPPPPPPPDADHPADPTTLPEPSISAMYSNIVQELESSLENVVRWRISTRSGDASNMLSSFSQRLDSILNQSDVILRHLSSPTDMLIPTMASRRYTSSESSVPSLWNIYDRNFYVRDLRSNGSSPDNNHGSSPDNNREETINLNDIFSSRPPYSAIESDHTYPRNPENVHGPPPPETSTPMMATIHLTIVHIQRQARILREQVDEIEQIDRAMLEVDQLQLVRRLTIELVRHVRILGGESVPTTTGGMSSVRQMMAGTRISDSSPYESPTEGVMSVSPPRPSTSRTPEAQPGGSSTSAGQPPARSRANQRKTYPPSRMLRLARQCRRPSMWHFFSRRYNRNARPPNPPTPWPPVRLPPATDSSSSTSQTTSNHAVIDSSRMSLMTRRLEQLLVEQMRIFINNEPPRPPSRSVSTIDLGEHILALRLHGCVLRVNRVLGNSVGSNMIGNFRADPTAAVTQDGMGRYGARHLLSLIIDSMSRHVEELGTSNNIQHDTQMQIQGILAMSLLLTELLLLIVVDSIPPPMNSVPERSTLTSRIDQLCGQMLQNRQCAYSQQLTRSLRLMKLTMRHANSALNQTYQARRNSMLPRQFTDRRILLGSINRCLRAINRRRATEEDEDNSGSNSSTQSNNDWHSIVVDIINQYSALNWDMNPHRLSTSPSRDRVPRPSRNNFSSNNDNTDDETERYPSSSSASSSTLYRPSNIPPAQPTGHTHSRTWNVPTVHINDVPVMDPPLSPSFAQRLNSHRQRFAERVSELRSNPQMGLYRPRFLHPLYASVNPFDADLDDPQRDQIYDSDMITTVTPNHRIQAWDISDWSIPNIGIVTRNVVVSECKIHNDASVDVAKDGTILVTLLPSGGYLNVTNRLGVYSLRWETLGQCLYTISFEQNAVSVSLSPLSRHLVVGLAARVVPSERWIMARVFKIDQKEEPGDRLPVVRELEQNHDSRINCIRWLPTSGQGLIYGTNIGQLVVLS